MYPGVLLQEFTISEVLATSHRSAVLRRDRGQVATPTREFMQRWG